jgi:hypothetical protein
MAIVVLRFLAPVLPVAAFVATAEGATVQVILYANGEAHLKISGAGSHLDCRGHFDHLTLPRPREHVATTHAQLHLGRGCTAQGDSLFAGQVLPDFDLIHSGGLASMAWLREPAGPPQRVESPDGTQEIQAGLPALTEFGTLGLNDSLMSLLLLGRRR